MAEDTGPAPAGFVFRADCPTRPILDQIADKWSMMVLAVLLDGPQRFNAIKRRLEGVTQRVLTHALRRLERSGIVSRTILDGRVLGVEYALTPLGRSLHDPMMVLLGWTTARMDEIREHQRRYDTALLADAVPCNQPVG